MGKKRTYAILTNASTRIEVKASSVDEAYRLANKKVSEYNKSEKLKRMGWIPKDDLKLTKSYMTFGSTGVNTQGFIINKSSIKAFEKIYR